MGRLWVVRFQEQAVCKAAVQFYGAGADMRQWMPLDTVEGMIASHARHCKDADLTAVEERCIRAALHCGLGELAEDSMDVMSATPQGIAGY